VVNSIRLMVVKSEIGCKMKFFGRTDEFLAWP
jgi:hypothetical protein